MSLSTKTVQNLSNALAPEVVDYIFNDERWVDFLHEIIPDAIDSTIGGYVIDEDLKFELSLCIIDKILLKVDS